MGSDVAALPLGTEVAAIRICGPSPQPRPPGSLGRSPPIPSHASASVSPSVILPLAVSHALLLGLRRWGACRGTECTAENTSRPGVHVRSIVDKLGKNTGYGCIVQCKRVVLYAFYCEKDRSTFSGKNKTMVTDIPTPMSLAGHGTLEGAGYIEMTNEHSNVFFNLRAPRT